MTMKKQSMRHMKLNVCKTVDVYVWAKKNELMGVSGDREES